MDIKIILFFIEDLFELLLFFIFMVVLLVLLNSFVSIGGKIGILFFFLGGGSGFFFWDRVIEVMSVERTGGVVGKGIFCIFFELLLVFIYDGLGIGEFYLVEGRFEGWGGGFLRNLRIRFRIGV